MGKTVYLHCQASGYPFPRYSWSKDGGGVVIGGRTTKVSGGSIRIREVTMNDSGVYTCHVMKGKHMLNLTAHVTVIGK